MSEEVFVFPVSFSQQRLWLFEQLVPGSPAYNIPSTINFKGTLDIEALERSLNEIVRRHETLRTTFATVNSQPVQVIALKLSLPLPVVDLVRYPEAERRAEARRLSREEAQRPFDLIHGPLLRATLLRLEEKKHLLLLTMHHIISDGWSVGVLKRELRIIYKAYSTGELSPLPDLPIQYADFACWQRQRLQGEVLESQLTYWKQQLAGAPEVLELPTDHPRPPVQSFRGEHQRLALSESLTEGLKALSQQEGVTLFMTLLAAFQVLLHRYTGQDDIVVGSPIANRTFTAIEQLIGFFVNTLVLRTDVSGDPSFRELLARVREVTMGAYAHQDLPFEKLVEELAPERSLSHMPLFQVMFVLQNVTTQASSTRRTGRSDSEPSSSLLSVERGTAKFDLTLSMVETKLGLVGTLKYNTDLFESATISRMMEHFQILLKGIVATPDQSISTLPLLTNREQQQVLVEWNDTSRDYPQHLCIHTLFEAQVERTPDTTAVVFEDQQLTYRELNQRANQLAHYLKALGVGSEVLVGICVERTLEMVVGVLGILKAGGAYVPLDPAAPQERLAFMLANTQVSVLLTQKTLIEGLPEQEVQALCLLDAEWEKIAQESAENLVSEVTDENLAYVLYTSGSTGKPKGVAVEHRQVLNYALAILERLDLGFAANFAMVQPLTVDSCITTIFPPLFTGGCLHLVSREKAVDADALGDYFCRHSIDCLKIAPSHLAALHASSRTQPIMPRHRLIIGGEGSRWSWVQKLQSSFPDCVIFNHYGPTETTVGSLAYRVDQGQGDRDYAMTPLGRPLANTQLYVLNRHMQPVPIGIPGELHIGGAGVTRGYLNRPDLTAEKFISNPFSNEPNARLYKTGDLVRYLPDGNIEFLGRIDHQVKIRGFRIELGEVEAVLSQHPDLRQVVIRVLEDASGDKRLVAYAVPHQEPAPAISELRRFMKKQLPEYMVPSAFVVLEALPLTPHGKVDLRALPAPDRARPEMDETFVAPDTGEEEALAVIWSKLLGMNKIGIHDNFFELGGHSLLATQLIARIRDTFQVELPLRTLFETPTIAGLAEVIAKVREKGTEIQSPEIVPLSREPYRVKVASRAVRLVLVSPKQWPDVLF